MYKSIISLFVLCLVVTPVSAEKHISDCEKKDLTLSEMSQCLDRVKSAVDLELQTWINNQTFILEELQIETGRGSALNMFKRSQTNFLTFRENNCRWQYLAVSPNPNASDVYKKCYITTAKARIQELSELKLTNLSSK